jgi:hypothetical protein
MSGATPGQGRPEVIGYDDHGGIITAYPGASAEERSKGDWTRRGFAAGTDHGSGHTARQAVPSGWGTSGPWARLAAATADFEPEDDGELLAWMAAEAAGMAGYGESLGEVYETVTGAVGVDPVALAALADCADDAAQAAAAMEAARAKFAAHYEEPREFAASGGVLPHDGRWVTGEGD